MDESGIRIRRWRDGVTWLLSRILDSFLYRELEELLPRKKATKRGKPLTKPGEPCPSPKSKLEGKGTYSQTLPKSKTIDPETERSLIGSLVDSYAFEDGRLVKKTMGVNVDSTHYHLETPTVSNDLWYVLD